MSSASPLAGHTLEGRFRLEALLGQGGMGVVYRALDTSTQRRVAVKLLEGDDPRRRERFRREGQATAALSHPGILRVHSIGETQGRAYLVYELVEGCQELGDVLDSLPLRRKVELVRDAARALGYAHQHGVVHRDVKPANLLVDAQGRLFVADFGLALVADTERLTRSGALLGTPTHMAPEQVHGLAHKSKPQVDVWALGVVLYQALSGELPFVADDWITLAAKITSGDPDRPSSIKGDVPAALEAICLQCLSVDPTRRYIDGEGLAQDLDAWLEGRAVMARQRSVLPPLLAFAGGLLLVALLVVAALSVGGSEGAVSSGSRPPAPEPHAGAVNLDQLEAKNREAEAGRELERLRYLEPAKRLPALRAWLAANPEHPRRGVAEEAYLEAGHEVPLGQFQTEKGETVATWIGPDRVLSCSYQRRVVELWDVSDPLQPRSDGRWEAPAVGYAPHVVANSVVALPGGRLLFGGGYTGTLWRGALDAPGELETWSLPQGRSTVRRLLVAGGRASRQVVLSWGRAVRVCDPLTWPLEERATLEPDGVGYPTALAVSPDGERVAALMRRAAKVSPEPDTLFVWKLSGAQVFRKPMPNSAGSVVFAPGGRAIAVGLRQGQLAQIALEEGAEWEEFGRPEGLFGRAHGSTVEGVGYSPDGRWLYSAAMHTSRKERSREGLEPRGELVVWDAVSRVPVRQVLLPAPPLSLEVGPRGELLLGLDSGYVQIWGGQ